MDADSPRVLVAPDSFKGTFGAATVAAALARGLARAGVEADACPVADGGEGTLDALLPQLGGERREVAVHDPLRRPLRAAFGLVPGDDGALAIVETAAASGLGLLAPDERDAAAASTAGTGELIAAAIDAGARTVLVGAGGSATTDGGAGALAAIAARGGLRGARLVVLCDVRVPFERAAEAFGPQKGADPPAIAALTARLHALAAHFARDPRGVPLTGCAGGLAGGLWAQLGAELVPGAAWVLDALGLDARLQGAAAVVTGEGSLDAQTLDGKLVAEVAARARAAGVPVHAVVGRDALAPEGHAALGLASVTEAGTPSALEAAGAALGQAVRDHAQR